MHSFRDKILIKSSANNKLNSNNMSIIPLSVHFTTKSDSVRHSRIFPLLIYLLCGYALHSVCPQLSFPSLFTYSNVPEHELFMNSISCIDFFRKSTRACPNVI